LSPPSLLLLANADIVPTLLSKKGDPSSRPVNATILTTAFKKSGGGAFVPSNTVCHTGAKLALSKVINAMIANPFLYSSSKRSSSFESGDDDEDDRCDFER
jgi:hypothetical protein